LGGFKLMVKAYQNYFKHLGNFSGTASRREFWWPWLLNVIVGYVIMTILFNIFGMNVTRVLNFQPGKETFLASLINFIIFIANWSLSVRRLHDTDRSGWWVLLWYVPIIGQIWLLIYFLLPTKKNRWNDRLA
ncbi:Inner membrane protein yhaI, partial [Lacticaseibacillus paracasei subsp. paracasei Lpp41]